ncbi:capsular exopolysaccharide synthesis family protein [Microbacterium trichothecenolyticum]|uniref:polysaccharide biosynthesis tyrosine autokinase n=1 Tax=Microbacterium trichothecenolyticum TaxID=69370 RepID=UPI0028560047|nr:polysaccharide biosynthesis tyrosine autokinase [Microbacterium trichothecenolyticum]MDR7187030.1 capsular exopolysaccharide synthesis family protein [Microbacterium trichothecenolyticum]
METRSLLRLIRHHWAVVVACLMLGALGGWALVVTTPREYTASADVFVTVTGGASTSELAQSSNFSQLQARNFSAIATREVVLEPVIETLDLDTTIAQLRRQVSTSVPLNTSVITISATDESPARAAAIANSVSTFLAEVVPSLTPRVDGQSPVRLQVIESATAPAAPSSPNVPLLLLTGLLAGLVAATVIVVMRGVVDARVRDKEQVTEITGLPLLGVISFDRRAQRDPIAVVKSGSRRGEEYRQLRANLRFLQPGQRHKVFSVTSSRPGEGKSATAANIAAALAASGLDVCLVEADLRRPTLSDVLDLPEYAGFTDVLTGDIALDDAIVTWGPDDLKVLLAGSRPPNPSELLESAAASEALQRIRDRFDVTIIDCPPLNPVSDGAVLAQMLGGVIFVIGARVLRVRELRRAVERLTAMGVSVEGAVFNMSRSREDHRYGYAPRKASARPAGRDAASDTTVGDTGPGDGSVSDADAPGEGARPPGEYEPADAVESFDDERAVIEDIDWPTDDDADASAHRRRSTRHAGVSPLSEAHSPRET